VRVLESVAEFAAEGTELHHCVFSNSYFLEKNSLILSATIDGKRIETIEVSLKTLKVVQSRGVCNSNTEYHDRIIRLVEDNTELIRQRMNAA
ncbi:PcfJ family protein, partial [Prevotella sp. PJ1A]|nr:PcfJ family protein [Prevotella sp. PJ1A]NPE40206.1 PcfJ family protein [Prevotella sp. PCJ2]